MFRHDALTHHCQLQSYQEKSRLLNSTLLLVWLQHLCYSVVRLLHPIGLLETRYVRERAPDNKPRHQQQRQQLGCLVRWGAGPFLAQICHTPCRSDPIPSKARQVVVFPI
jgi:hypothetical protein